VSYNEVMRRLGLAGALAGLAIFGTGCAGAHHDNASMRPGGILASGTCWNVRTHRGTVTRTRFKCSDYHPVVYRRTRAAAYAYELPIDPNNPNWHRRPVLRSKSPSTSGPSNGPRPMPIGTRSRIIPVRPAIRRRLKHLHGARFLSPTRLAFLTSGSGSCPSVPVRLVVQTPHAIRIDLAIGSWHRTASGLRVQVPHLPPGGACLDNLVSSPVVIAIDPKQIDVHRGLRVSLYYRKGVVRSHHPVAFTAPSL
jgi:hypothetical protein